MYDCDRIKVGGLAVIGVMVGFLQDEYFVDRFVQWVKLKPLHSYIDGVSSSGVDQSTRHTFIRTPVKMRENVSSLLPRTDSCA